MVALSEAGENNRKAKGNPVEAEEKTRRPDRPQADYPTMSRAFLTIGTIA
jgi:hypothetical protein